MCAGKERGLTGPLPKAEKTKPKTLKKPAVKAKTGGEEEKPCGIASKRCERNREEEKTEKMSTKMKVKRFDCPVCQAINYGPEGGRIQCYKCFTDFEHGAGVCTVIVKADTKPRGQEDGTCPYCRKPRS